MVEVDIKTCLRQWRRKYGEEKTGKAHGQTYWRIPIQSRRHLLVIFLRWMKMLGVEQERFTKVSFQNELIDICFGTAPAFDEKKRKGGHQALREELEDILATEGIFDGKRRKNNKNSKPTAIVPKESGQEVFKKVGRKVDRELYKDVSNHETQIDTEFLALLEAAKKDE